jgi:hypothetical protein
MCLFELHRLRLAQKGRQLQKQINCPLGCDDFILKKDLRFHLQYLCTQRQVPCRFAPLCRSLFVEVRRHDHEETECVYLNKNRLIVSHQKMQSALRPCGACSALVRVRDQEVHDQQLCAHRITPCVHADCPKTFQAHRLEHHLRFDCESRALRRRALLIERARARTHYPREWGEVVEYDVEEQADADMAVDGPEGEEKEKTVAAASDANGEQDSPEGRKVVIIPEDFDKPVAEAGDGEGVGEAGAASQLQQAKGQAAAADASVQPGSKEVEVAEQVRAPPAKSLRA